MNIVKLSVHKNTLEQRKEKQMRKEAVGYFKECINKPNIAGYAIAVWDKNGKIISCSDTSNKKSPITRHTLPETLKMTFIERYTNG